MLYFISIILTQEIQTGITWAKKSHVVPHFYHLQLTNKMMPLRMPSLSCDAYIYTCLSTYIHTCSQDAWNTCMHTLIHTYIMPAWLQKYMISGFLEIQISVFLYLQISATSGFPEIWKTQNQRYWDHVCMKAEMYVCAATVTVHYTV